jgi:hypothetical protein
MQLPAPVPRSCAASTPHTTHHTPHTTHHTPHTTHHTPHTTHHTPHTTHHTPHETEQREHVRAHTTPLLTLATSMMPVLAHGTRGCVGSARACLHIGAGHEQRRQGRQVRQGRDLTWTAHRFHCLVTCHRQARQPAGHHHPGAQEACNSPRRAVCHAGTGGRGGIAVQHAFTAQNGGTCPSQSQKRRRKTRRLHRRQQRQAKVGRVTANKQHNARALLHTTATTHSNFGGGVARRQLRTRQRREGGKQAARAKQGQEGGQVRVARPQVYPARA